MTAAFLKHGSELWELTKSRIRLENLMDSIKASHQEISRPEFYMFATFTAIHGRPVAEQLAENASGHRFGSGPKSGARSSRGGSSARFPKLTDDAIRKHIAGKGEVSKGFFRQYFCRVDNSRNKAEVVAEIEIPIKFRDPKVARAGQKTNMEMSRDKKFSLSEFDSYIESIKSECDEIGSMLIDSLTSDLWKERTEWGGPEHISKSATDSRSEGGLIIIERGKPLPKYCPECSLKLLEAFEGGSERILFPPLPSIPLAMGNRLFCTENLHRDHGEEDCTGLSELCAKINQIRIDQGKDEWRLVPIEADEIKGQDSSIFWIDSKILPR